MNNVWRGYGITDEALEEAAEWLSQDHSRFPGSLVAYFRTAGHLLRFTHQQFTVLPLVFVQMVIGLEKVLRVVYKDTDHKLTLSALLQKAFDDGHFNDVGEMQWRPSPKRSHPNPFKVTMPDQSLKAMVTHIPKLRNELLHGEYMLTHELLELSLYLRRMVDALIPHLPKSFIEECEEAASATVP